jgi:penicillin-binding protein 2
VRLGTRSDLREYDQQFRRILVLFLFTISLLIVRLVQLQLIEGDYYRSLAVDNAVNSRALPAYRGAILDNQGRVLAENRPSYDVTVAAAALLDEPGAIELLSRHLALAEVDIERLRTAADSPQRQEIRLRRDITRDQVARLETDRLRLPGVRIQAISHRHYPYDSLAVHLLGYMGEISSQHLESLEEFGYDEGDYVGFVGLEQSLEPVLRGFDGYEQYVVDARGRLQTGEIADMLLGDYPRVDPIPGRDVSITVDLDLQRIVVEAMQGYRTGAAVAVDPRDGSILAMVSIPTYNPNAWTGRLSREEMIRDTTNEDTPLYDRAIHAYFPGSTFKIVTAAAALEEGLIGPNDTLHCDGHYSYGNRDFTCNRSRGHGDINLAEALQQSCNVFFYKLAERLGMERLVEYGHAFGFGTRPGSGLPNEAAGLIPTHAWLDEHSPEGFQYGQVLNVSVGQGDTRVSPLQMALAYSAIANGGVVYYPRLVDSITNDTGAVIFQYPSRVRRRLPLSSDHIEEVRRGLIAAVNREGGTVYASRLEYVTVAGKTGTAQGTQTDTIVLDEDGVVPWAERTSAWFAGFAPADDPRIAVVVFLEHGGSGGRNAAPVGVEIMDRYFREVLDYETEITTALASGETDELEGLMRLGRRGIDGQERPFESVERYLYGHYTERTVEQLIRQWRDQQ